MHRTEKNSVGGLLVVLLVLLTAIAFKQGFATNPKWYGILYITIPLLLILYFFERQKLP